MDIVLKLTVELPDCACTVKLVVTGLLDPPVPPVPPLPVPVVPVLVVPVLVLPVLVEVLAVLLVVPPQEISVAPRTTISATTASVRNAAAAPVCLRR